MNLSEKAMLAKLSISQWSARKHDKGATKEVISNHGAQDGTGKFSKVLIEKNAIKAIQTASNSARTFHYENTLPWNDSGFRILPSKNFQRYSEGMRSLKGDFESAVSDFLKDYSWYRQSAQYQLGSLFNSSDYPDDSKISGKFNFDTEINPLPDANDFRVSLQSNDVDRIKRDIENKVNANVNLAVNDLWQRLFDAVNHMAAKLADKDAIFRNSLINNLCELCDLLPALNITDDPKIEEMRREIESRLCSFEPDQLRENEIERQKAATEADAIAQIMAGYMG